MCFTPRPLRDLFMRLALWDAYRARWSARVHAEWIEALLRQRPDLNRTQLERTRNLMDAHARDALVEGFEDLIDGLHLPDPDDRHVLAAAIRGRASVIVTLNLADFPEAILHPYGIEAQHPDHLCVRLFNEEEGLVLAAVQDHRASLQNPPKTVEAYLATLESSGLPQTVADLRAYAGVI